MHHIKSDARKTAYNDPLNPFGRRRPKRGSTTSRAEEGQMSPLHQVASMPNGESIHETVTGESSRPHPQTLPASMRKRPQEAGDDVVFEETASPRASTEEAPAMDEKKVVDRSKTNTEKTELTQNTEKTLTNGTTTSALSKSDSEPKKRGMGKVLNMFGKKDDHEETAKDGDDNNGKKKQHFTLMGQLRATIFGSWINILLIASPVGIALHFAKVKPIPIFVVNFIAIIPLAGMLSYATEEIALRTGEVIGGLLNASFGNAVELIVSIIALFQKQYLIVQTSLIGSMLSNLLLVMGMCFFAGGINRMKQSFNMTVAQTASSLLFLAVSSLIIPTAFEAWAQTGNTSDRTTSGQTLVNGVQQLSDATSVILLFIYACYLFFQLKSHKDMYMAKSEKTEKRDFSESKRKWKERTGVLKLKRRHTPEPETPTSSQQARNNEEDDEEEEEEQPQLSLIGALITLAASTVLVALNAEFLVDSINEVTCTTPISKTFVGLILLPIVGNAAEHATAVTVAIKDKMDLAIGVAVGSSMQIALLVLPLVVVIGWIAGKEGMNLYFDGFQLAMLFVAVLLVNYLIQDGESHWLEGILLMMLYLIIAVAAWYYPTDASQCPTGSS